MSYAKPHLASSLFLLSLGTARGPPHMGAGLWGCLHSVVLSVKQHLSSVLAKLNKRCSVRTLPSSHCCFIWHLSLLQPKGLRETTEVVSVATFVSLSRFMEAYSVEIICGRNTENKCLCSLSWSNGTMSYWCNTQYGHFRSESRTLWIPLKRTTKSMVVFWKTHIKKSRTGTSASHNVWFSSLPVGKTVIVSCF